MDDLGPCHFGDEPDKICVIVHGAKNLQSKKKGRCKFSVIFGIGSKKFRTDVIEDVFGSPVWNEEAQLEVEDASQNLVLTVTEKDDVLGQVVVQLNELPLSKPVQGRRVPLRAHKKCPDPHGEIILSAWITDMRTPRASKKASPSSGAMKTLKKMKSKIGQSPLLRRKNSSKESSPVGMKGSMSVGDLAGFGRKKTNLLTVPSDSMCSITSTDSDASNQFVASSTDIRDNLKRPEISGISPREGPVGGGTRLTLRGINLGRSIDDIQSLYICGSDCTHTIEYESTSKLFVTTMPWKAGSGDIVFQTASGGRATAMVQFTYRDSDKVSPLPNKRMSPMVMRHISPSGSLKKRRSSDTSSLSSGSFNAGIPEEDGRPEVSGISPKEGPIEGGTRLIIRGQNLGTDREDIICVMICGKDCTDTLEYESPRKLYVTTKAWKPGPGEIIVDTTSGGQGSSTVKFTYLMPSTPSPVTRRLSTPSASSPSTRRLSTPNISSTTPNVSSTTPNVSATTPMQRVEQAMSEAELKMMNPPSPAFGDLDDDDEDESLLKPEVTGVSPREASTEGGTRLTLRGINLGANAADVIGLRICGADCLSTLQYESPMKLHCVTPPWKVDKGKIIVETEVGGVGSSLVQFAFKKPSESLPPSSPVTNVPKSPFRTSTKSSPVKPPRKPTGRNSALEEDVVDSPAKPEYHADVSAAYDDDSVFDDSIKSAYAPPKLPKSAPPSGSQKGVTVAGVTRDESTDYSGGATPYPDEASGIPSGAVPYPDDGNPFVTARTDSASPAAVDSSTTVTSARTSTRKSTSASKSESRSHDVQETRPQPLGQEKRMSPVKERKRQAPAPPGDHVPSHKPPPHPGHRGDNNSQKPSSQNIQNLPQQPQKNLNTTNMEDYEDKTKGPSYTSKTNKPEKDHYIQEQNLERETQSGPTRQELMEEIRRVKMENRSLHEENHLMKQYLERLVSDVMMQCPELLCVDNSQPRPF